MNTNTDLIPLSEGAIHGHVQPLCDARDLHEFLEVRRDFTNWIKQRVAKYGFVENQDFVCVEGLALSPNLANQSSIENVLATEPSLNVRLSAGRGGDRRSIAYHISLDMAKELSMVENNERGRQARRYFIERERLSYEAYAKEAPGSDHGLRMEQPISLLIPPQAVITCIMPDMRVHTVFWPDKTSHHKVVLGSTSALQDYISGLQSPMSLPILFATPLWFDLMGRRAIAITDDTSRADGNVPHALFPAAQCLIIGSEEETIKLCNDKGYSIDSYLVPRNETERRVKP